MEFLLKVIFTNRLMAKSLIRPRQHGVVEGRSFATNLLNFLEKATASIDRGEPFDVMFSDFAKHSARSGTSN
jgi:hypothetical protein